MLYEVITLCEIEYCQPFDISILEKAGGKYWSLKYVQSAKTITDEMALQLLQTGFEQNRTNELLQFEHPSTINGNGNPSDAEEWSTDAVTEENYQEVLNTVPDVKINITSTYVTVKFETETDQSQGS